jgi:nucleoside-diphosphate-sugar epimerase
MSKIFITGGTGFLGSRVVRSLLKAGHSLILLDRSGSARGGVQASPHVEIVSGDVLEPEKYRESLRSAATVIHLAASTGKASESEHFRVNEKGTQILVEECRRAGVQRFLLVSTIAVTFPDKTRYYYAQAKTRAEDVLRASGLRFTIVRPTMILGPESPILKALEKLASLPIVPIFGNGKTLVQPVFVEDAAEFIRIIAEEDAFDGRTIELGGPSALSIEQLLQQIRLARKGSRGRVMHLPLSLILPGLIAAESAGLGKVMPFSVGQLATFRFDGVAANSALFESVRQNFRSIPEMVALDGTASRDELPLDRECRVFTRHLLGCSPQPYVVRKYVEAHEKSPTFSEGSRLDAFLIRIARSGPGMTQLADGYTRIFHPGALLRKKLVLLLAILETSSPTYRLMDAVERGGRLSLALRLLVSGASAVAAIVAGAIVFVPARIWFGAMKSPKPAIHADAGPDAGMVRPAANE